MRALAVAVALTILMAACGEDEAAAPDPAALRGEAWVLTSGVDVEGWEQIAPSATFTDEVSGFAGCNRYSAPYTVDGARLELGAGRESKIGCSEHARAVAMQFHDALNKVTAWAMDEQQLVLLGDGGAELLRFAPASVAGGWTVTAFRLPGSVSSPLEGTELTATFSDDGKLSGNAGCNAYTTTYRAQRRTIEIAAPSAAEMACEQPEGVMEQERAYLDALPAAATYELGGSNLMLLAADGTIVATMSR